MSASRMLGLILLNRGYSSSAGPSEIGEGAPKEGKSSRQDHAETPTASFHSLHKDWQQKSRRMFWIVIDRLVGNTELRPSSQWFTAA
jgi:hypothetical protein